MNHAIKRQYGNQTIRATRADTKSFTLNYIDWRNPANNGFHVVEEFEVERTASKETCRPDVVLFVNGMAEPGTGEGTGVVH